MSPWVVNKGERAHLFPIVLAFFLPSSLTRDFSLFLDSDDVHHLLLGDLRDWSVWQRVGGLRRGQEQTHADGDQRVHRQLGRLRHSHVSPRRSFHFHARIHGEMGLRRSPLSPRPHGTGGWA